MAAKNSKNQPSATISNKDLDSCLDKLKLFLREPSLNMENSAIDKVINHLKMIEKKPNLLFAYSTNQGDSVAKLARIVNRELIDNSPEKNDMKAAAAWQWTYKF
jgi:hypothetical protein